jgi:hypothetical protein
VHAEVLEMKKERAEQEKHNQEEQKPQEASDAELIPAGISSSESASQPPMSLQASVFMK